jgi:hypothetical protein
VNIGILKMSKKSSHNAEKERLEEVARSLLESKLGELYSLNNLVSQGQKSPDYIGKKDNKIFGLEICRSTVRELTMLLSPDRNKMGKNGGFTWRSLPWTL